MQIIEQPAGRRNTRENHPEIAIHLKAVLAQTRTGILKRQRSIQAWQWFSLHLSVAAPTIMAPVVEGIEKKLNMVLVKVSMGWNLIAAGWSEQQSLVEIHLPFSKESRLRFPRDGLMFSR